MYVTCPYKVSWSDSKFEKLAATHTLYVTLYQVAAALTYLHSRAPPIMHRDIKLDNILMTGGWLICRFVSTIQLGGWLFRFLSQPQRHTSNQECLHMYAMLV